MRPADFRTSRLTEEPDHTSDDADKADAAGDDRLVGRVFRDQLDVAVAPFEPLDGGIAVDQRDHDRSIGRFVLRPDQHQVVIENAGVDHAVAAHPEQEIAFLGQLGREQDVVLDVLLCQDRAPRRHVADDGYRDGGPPLLVQLGILDDLHGARLARVALDQAPALQLVEVVVDGRARAQADRLADLAHAGRVVPGLGDGADVVEDPGLPFSEVFGQFEFFSKAWVGTLQAMLAPRRGERKLLFAALTSERAFAILPNVCTPPATGSNLGGQPVPAAFARSGALRSCWAWWPLAAWGWPSRRMAARRRPRRRSWCSPATPCRRSPPRPLRLARPRGSARRPRHRGGSDHPRAPRKGGRQPRTPARGLGRFCAKSTLQPFR